MRFCNPSLAVSVIRQQTGCADGKKRSIEHRWDLFAAHPTVDGPSLPRSFLSGVTYTGKATNGLDQTDGGHLRDI